jgi:hypothetical protein
VKNIRLLADVHISPKTVADLQKQGYAMKDSTLLGQKKYFIKGSKKCPNNLS